MLLDNRIKQLYTICICALFAASFVAFIAPSYFVIALPLALLVVGLFFLSLEHVLYLIAFCTPFSIKIMFGDSGINFPDEPLMLVFLLLFIFKIIIDPKDLKPLFKESLSFIIGLNLLWILITTINSSMPIISFKFFLARLWTVVLGYCWGLLLLKNPKKIKTFLWSFGLGLCLVVIYTTINHYPTGFSQKTAWKVMKPLMDDHTVYSAICSIVLLYSLVILFFKNVAKSIFDKMIALILVVFSLTGVILSYSRAAALSVVFALFFYILLVAKIRFRTLVFGLIILLSLCVIFNNEIYQRIRFNRSASGKTLVGDIKSISNIKNDDSNVERLNRWESGFRMFKEKPILGFGPGTYMFLYSPYQRANEMTSISSTTGTMGGIHSEFFGPAIETGIIGFFITMMLFGMSIYILMQIYYQSKNTELKMLSLAILLALMSYYFHGLMNNFLDQDKASVIFWGMMGITVSLKIQHLEELKKI